MEPTYRIVVEYDPDPDLTWLNLVNEDDYNRDPVFLPRLGRYLSYEEYIDPWKYEVFLVSLQTQCPECGHWFVVDSVGGVTYFSYDCSVYPGTFTLEEARDMDVYLLELFGLEGAA